MGLWNAILGIPESPFQTPSLLFQIITKPLHFILTNLHTILVQLRGTRKIRNKDALKIVCISDTHCFIATIPEGDVLIHAGDLTKEGTVSEIQTQLDWLDKLPHQHIIVIAGNHDSYFDPRSRRPQDFDKKLDFKRIQYLQHSGIVLEFASKGDRKLMIYGSPQIPECGGEEHAFQYRRQDDAWSGTLPKDVDVLVTHTPPRWHLDLPGGIGCDFLLKEVWRVKPELHVFGHVHAGHGNQTVYWDRAQEAYEKAMAKQGLFDPFKPTFWLDYLVAIIYDIIGIIWTRVWGSESQSTIMVNAAVVDYYGRLRHRPQVIVI